MEIIVFVTPRTECKSCKDAEDIVEEVLRELGMMDKVSYRKLTSDTPEAARLQVMITPCVVVDDQIVAHGSPPDPGKLADYLCGTLG